MKDEAEPQGEYFENKFPIFCILWDISVIDYFKTILESTRVSHTSVCCCFLTDAGRIFYWLRRPEYASKDVSIGYIFFIDNFATLLYT